MIPGLYHGRFNPTGSNQCLVVKYLTHYRKVLMNEIENTQKLLEDKGDKWSEEVRHNHQKVLEDLKKRYEELG